MVDRSWGFNLFESQFDLDIVTQISTSLKLDFYSVLKGAHPDLIRDTLDTGSFLTASLKSYYLDKDFNKMLILAALAMIVGANLSQSNRDRLAAYVLKDRDILSQANGPQLSIDKHAQIYKALEEYNNDGTGYMFAKDSIRTEFQNSEPEHKIDAAMNRQRLLRQYEEVFWKRGVKFGHQKVAVMAAEFGGIVRYMQDGGYTLAVETVHRPVALEDEQSRDIGIQDEQRGNSIQDEDEQTENDTHEESEQSYESARESVPDADDNLHGD